MLARIGESEDAPATGERGGSQPRQDPRSRYRTHLGRIGCQGYQRGRRPASQAASGMLKAGTTQRRSGYKG